MARPRRTSYASGSKKVKSEDEDSLEPANIRKVSKTYKKKKSTATIDTEDEQEEEEEKDDDDDSELEIAEADSQGFWKALEILDETSTQYRIKWAGTNEKGKPWEPTWEPKSHANSELIAAWKKDGRRKRKLEKEAERLAKQLKKKEAKEKKQAKETAKQKKAKGKQIMKMKEDSPDPQPAFEEAAPDVREKSLSKSPAPAAAPSKVNRKRVVPDSETSSQARSDAAAETHQSKKQKADSRPSKSAKQVTFELSIDSSQLSSLPASAEQPAPVDKGKGVEVEVPEEARVEVAPIVSSGESSASIIPDSQPAPTKAFMDYSSPEPQSQPDYPAADSTRSSPEPIPLVAQPVLLPSHSLSQSHSHSHPSLDSPGTNHSDLESDRSHGDDDVQIFNDPSQHDDEIDEEEEEEGQRERYSSFMNTTTFDSRPLRPIPVPRGAAFFPASTQPESSQFDPIEDPDSSPYRPSAQRSERPLPLAKSRLELVAGPSEIDNEPPQLTEDELRRIASQAIEYLSPSQRSLLSISRTSSRASLVKRPASQPIIAPISFEVQSGGVASVAAVSQAVLPVSGVADEDAETEGGDAEEDDEDDDDLSPGGFNEDYFASDLIATQAQAPIDFDDLVDYDGAIAGNNLDEFDGAVGESQSEAVDAGEGGGHGERSSNGGGYSYSQQYSANQPQQNHQNYNTSGPSPSGYAAGQGGGGGASSSGGQGGGYPYPSNFQPSHQHSHQSIKREYEDEREESAKRARMEQQQYFQHQQRQQQEQQAAYSHAQQQYYQQAQNYGSYPPQNHGYSSSSASSNHQHYSPPPPQQQQNAPQYHNYQQQPYRQLPPMQTSPPPVQTYSRSSSQLPPIHQALATDGYTHRHSPAAASPPPAAPAPTVSVAAASPPRPRSPVVPAPPQQAQPPAGAHLTSPSVARVINSTTTNLGLNSTRSPSPLPAAAAARASSPAPSLDGVNDLIELVRASTQIEGSDGTKEEIVRFLRNPRGYGEGALSRADFWAFELRRQMLDVGERVDFIILYTRDGTFKLKRSPTTTIPVEFARSLTHAPDRVRGQTPAVDAILTLQASSSAPSPLVVSSMTREQLEQELTSLRSQVSTLTTELSTLRPLSEETVKLRTEVATLTQSNKQLKNSRDSAQQDMSYIQEQYSIASTAASARAQEAAIAEAEASRLQGLLDAGLKQKAAFYEAGVKKWKLEVERMKKEVELVRVERRKMNERGIREKAGKWDEVVARRETKKARIASGHQSKEEQEEEEEEDSEEETVSNLLLGDRPKSKTPPPTIPSIIKLVPDSTVTSSQPSSSAPDSSVPVSTAGEEGGQVGYRCEWRGETQYDSQAQPNSTACGILLPTKEALMDHAISHVD